MQLYTNCVIADKHVSVKGFENPDERKKYMGSF